MNTVIENRALWLDALRSGEYPQGTNFLKANGNYCCLGVAAELFRPDDIEVSVTQDDDKGELTSFGDCVFFAPDYVVEALGLLDNMGESNSGKSDSLAFLNDHGMTFSEIANIFEQNLEEYTK